MASWIPTSQSSTFFCTTTLLLIHQSKRKKGQRSVVVPNGCDGFVFSAEQALAEIRATFGKDCALLKLNSLPDEQAGRNCVIETSPMVKDRNIMHLLHYLNFTDPFVFRSLWRFELRNRMVSIWRRRS